MKDIQPVSGRFVVVKKEDMDAGAGDPEVQSDARGCGCAGAEVDKSVI